MGSLLTIVTLEAALLVAASRRKRQAKKGKLHVKGFSYSTSNLYTLA